MKRLYCIQLQKVCSLSEVFVLVQRPLGTSLVNVKGEILVEKSVY